MEIFDNLKAQFNRLLGIDSKASNVTELLAELESTEKPLDFESRLQEIESKLSSLDSISQSIATVKETVEGFTTKLTTLESNTTASLKKIATDTAYAIATSNTTSLSTNTDPKLDQENGDDKDKGTIEGSLSDIINFSSTRPII